MVEATNVNNNQNPYKKCFSILENFSSYSYINLEKLDKQKVSTLPFAIRILLEQAIRNYDGFNTTEKDVENILNWENTSKQKVEIPFKPARVVLQDLTGVPAVVDLASMRDVMVKLNKDPELINPKIPTELVIDHSIQVDSYGNKDSLLKNEELEFKRNNERFQFLKWGQKNIKNFLIVPPGSGIVHQVNLEYLARCVFKNDDNGLLYPDTCVGADSHTPMINGLGVLGWGVGGIEAEAAMLGQTISMLLPEVVGVKLSGKLDKAVTATDLVLTITEILRKKGVVGKFVEYYGEGCKQLSIADRATIANMAPEYGATTGFFAIDEQTLDYLKQTGRQGKDLKLVEEYSKANSLFRSYDNNSIDSKVIYSEVVEVDLNKIVPCLAGPKRPQDRVQMSNLKKEFEEGLTAKVSFKSFGLNNEKAKEKIDVVIDNKTYSMSNGSLVIAAITSCTNTSNPDVMISAGLMAKKACENNLSVLPFVKTSLSPGSGVVTRYLQESGLLPYLEKLGFNLSGYGCMTCIGNSGELIDPVADAITKSDLVFASVLSGNRNFEGRVHNLIKANYLASPPLVVAYALAGKVNIDFEKEEIGKNSETGQSIYLSDIWPSKEEIADLISKNITPKMFQDIYLKISKGTEAWNSLTVNNSINYNWNSTSTYIKEAPFFDNMFKELKDKAEPIKDAKCLLLLGDSITTDHISPAGSIAKNSSAAKYLMEKGFEKKDFNTYGSRRGNYEVMARGTYANVRLVNKLVEEVGSKTKHFPSNEIMDIYSASEKYKKENKNLIVIAGKEYGSGSSRDWAAKGPYLLGIKAVIAESYERIHRSNLAGMGILPLEFKKGENAEFFKLKGNEDFNILLEEKLKVGMDVCVETNTNIKFLTKLRLDTVPELEYYKCGGILQYVLRKLK